MQSESFFYFLWQVRDYPARNCSTERTINFSFIETENCIYARATINIQCKHGFLVQWRRVIHPKRLVITAIMRLLIFVTLDGKTYTNDFLFSNGFPFTSCLCQPFERLGHPFARNSLFEYLGGGYSGFQVTGMIKGFFWVWNFWFRDFFGYENLASIFLGSLIWVVKLFVLFLPGLVLFRVIQNITVETKPFMGVSSTHSSLLKWLADEGKDIFRWYDE